MEISVIYGEYRLRIAEWAGKDPDELTGDDVARYEAEMERSQL